MSNDIETLEIEINQARAVIKLNDDLQKLFKDAKFKQIILKGYFEDEAMRLCALKSDRAFQTEDGQKTLDRQIWGLGALNAYFTKIEQVAATAQQAMDEMEQTQNELMDEAV